MTSANDEASSSQRVIVPELSDRPIRDLVSLAGRTAVVTGGASGIGNVVVRRLAEAGARVVIADREGADSAASDLVATGFEAASFKIDVRDEGAIRELADMAVERFGGIDIWVNNVGISGPIVDALELSSDGWRDVLRVDIDGVFFGAQAAAKHMKRAGRGGVIVNISSAVTYRSRPKFAAYIAAKSAVNGLTRALAKEFGPFGVRVLGVAPGLALTPALESRISKEILDYASATLGRPGRPDDIARVVLFCVSDLAAYMTGTTLIVDGGSTA